MCGQFDIHKYQFSNICSALINFIDDNNELAYIEMYILLKPVNYFLEPFFSHFIFFHYDFYFIIIIFFIIIIILY